MADISKIVVPSGDEYDIKDSTSRSGLADKMDKTNPTGTGSFSLNRKANTPIGTNSFAEGNDTTASGQYSHAEGASTRASGRCAHTEGSNSVASGTYCPHAEGSQTTASGSYSHAEGFTTTASGDNSHSESYHTTASGNASHAENSYTTASGNYSHSEGYYTTANCRSQHVMGEYNVLDDSATAAHIKGTYVEIVGNGTADNSRSNARTLDWSGNEVLSGTIEATGFGTTLDKEVDRGGVQLTQAQYDALVNAGTVDANTTYFITDGQNITTASAVSYDNTASGLTATNVQNAIDEVNGKGIGDIDDVNLSSLAESDVLAYDGTNWVNFDLSALKSASTASANPVTCAHNTYTECVHITLDKGLYFFIGMLGFATNSTGVRGISISLNSGDTGYASSRLYVNACSGVQTRFQTVFLGRVENNSTTYYLNAWQNSGNNLNVIYSTLTAIKIGI